MRHSWLYKFGKSSRNLT